MLGPVYVKAGQLFASRKDIVSEALAAELSQLCESNQLQMMSADDEHVRALVEETCRERLNKEFADVFSGPLTFRHGASLADVYFGATHEYGEVAVKTIRPGVREMIARDKPLLEMFSSIGGKRVRMFVDEMFKTLNEECDLQKEMENTLMFRKCVCESKCKCPKAPLPYFSSKSVLVMERLDCLELAVTPMLMRCGLRTCITQLILKGFLHADPHAGNLKVGPDGRLVFLDFGAVVRLKPHQGISMITP